jgi:hypothetical protein
MVSSAIVSVSFCRDVKVSVSFVEVLSIGVSRCRSIDQSFVVSRCRGAL